jgi:hypothetical protein
MTNDEFERLNYLSEKAITETATLNELREFKRLMDLWNMFYEFNLLNNGVKKVKQE